MLLFTQFQHVSQAISHQPQEDAHGGGGASERPVQRGVPVLRQGVFDQLHCMHPRRCEIGFMPASARFAARVSKVEERPEGAHDVVAQRHARSQVTAVQQVLEAGKQLQKCVSSQCRKIMITLVRFLLHKQYYQRDHHPSHGSDELNNDEDSECICFMIS